MECDAGCPIHCSEEHAQLSSRKRELELYHTFLSEKLASANQTITSLDSTRDPDKVGPCNLLVQIEQLEKKNAKLELQLMKFRHTFDEGVSNRLSAFAPSTHRAVNCILAKFAVVSFRNALEFLQTAKYEFINVTPEEVADLTKYFSSFIPSTQNELVIDVDEMDSWLDFVLNSSGTFLDYHYYNQQASIFFKVKKSSIKEIIEAYKATCALDRHNSST